MQTEQLILNGEGYQLAITPEAEKLKAELLAIGGEIHAVTDQPSGDVARAALKRLAEFRNQLERSRKAVKEPVLNIGKAIDNRAVEFGKEVKAQEDRITKIVSDFAAAEAAARKKAEDDARRAIQEAERLRAEKERADIARERAELERQRAELEAAKANQATPAGVSGGGGFLAKRRAAIALAEAEQKSQSAVKQGEQVQEALEDATMLASDAFIAATVPAISGVKPALDFEVTDLAALYRHAPHLVTLTANRGQILAALKQMQNLGGTVEVPGLRIVEKFTVSKR